MFKFKVKLKGHAGKVEATVLRKGDVNWRAKLEREFVQNDGQCIMRRMICYYKILLFIPSPHLHKRNSMSFARQANRKVYTTA